MMKARIFRDSRTSLSKETSHMALQNVLIDGKWQASSSKKSFAAENPATQQPLADTYPVSSWEDCDRALTAAARAAAELRALPPERVAVFLERFAEIIEQRAAALVDMANSETGLPKAPRLAEVELPRTSGQLRQAAAAAREGSWTEPTIDTKANIRSYYAPLGPVWVFGPNNFPFAFNSVAGGDFAAAIAARNPVIAKANTSHPGTTRLLAEAAHDAAQRAELPSGSVQLLYRLEHEDGARAVADERTGAVGYTGSRSAGLKLKEAADRAGKPIYLELSSVNPVVMLPGALRERGDKIAEEFSGSCLMGAGQFCTNPGLVILISGDDADRWVQTVTQRFQSAPVGTLLSKSVAKNLEASHQKLRAAGAEPLTGGSAGGGTGYSFANTLLRVSGKKFLADPEACQTEAFGNSSLLVTADSPEQAAQVIDALEGNLTGTVYSDTAGSDDPLYQQLAPRLRQRVGRLLNDKMPTGVAVSPAMNHGGPFPATGHPGFTAVGIPASIKRFAMLQCFDAVRPERLPHVLRNKNPTGKTWRLIDGAWTQGDVA